MRVVEESPRQQNKTNPTRMEKLMNTRQMRAKGCPLNSIPVAPSPDVGRGAGPAVAA